MKSFISDIFLHVYCFVINVLDKLIARIVSTFVLLLKENSIQRHSHLREYENYISL